MLPIESVTGSTGTRIKVAFFDLDGTLVRGSDSISGATAEALNYLRSKGVKTAIATGRPLFGASRLVERLAIAETSLFFSGALLINPRCGSLLKEVPVGKKTIEAALQGARQQGLYVELYSKDTLFGEVESPLAQMHAKYIGRLPEMESLEKVMRREKILKVGLIASTPEECGKMREVCHQLSDVSALLSVGAADPHITFASITSLEASRQNAFDSLLGHFGVRAEEVAAFGDADADIPFLSLAGYGVAMGNAAQRVQDAARYVTRSVDEDGVAFAVDCLRSVL